MDFEDAIILLDKYKVDRLLFDLVSAHFESVRPFLLRDTCYTWHELLGEEFFMETPVWPSFIISSCLQHIEAQPGSQLRVLPSGYGDPTYFIFLEHKG